ncbi:MAG TPA: acVLRF1 family peptidyl-tRNA hydrolase [Kineosporiaceae bacterium]|nr:acVLRF1 family peptidyl-tRNA hydrolase [Kineosporiaceae bacterium]
MGSGQDHGRGPRAAPRAGLQRLSAATSNRRTVEVGAGRLERWAAGFEERHGAVAASVDAEGLTLAAADGAAASFAHPWGRGTTVAEFAAAVLAPRRVGVLLVRRGGYACAVLHEGRVAASKVGHRYVQGRTAAGGWSQQRFARRREKQTGELAGSAADVAARLLLDPLPDGLATGGDRPLVDRVLADPRLRRLADLPRGPHLAVGDPSADVVRALPDLLTRVAVTLTEPAVRRGQGQETTTNP